MDCIKNKIWTTKSNDYIISFDNINSDAQITNVNYIPTNGDTVDDQPTLIDNKNENKFKHYGIRFKSFINICIIIYDFYRNNC